MCYYDNDGVTGLNHLLGRNIVRVHMDQDTLDFHTDTGQKLSYYVDGDCCSSSYFYDMHGVEKLLENGPITEVGQIELNEPDDEDSRKGDCVRAYGYKLITESPKWGEQTTVFSFRNDSNGYYGGEIHFRGISSA